MSFRLVELMKWMMSLQSLSEVKGYAGEFMGMTDHTDDRFTAENYAISYPFTFSKSGWYMLIINQTMLQPTIVSSQLQPWANTSRRIIRAKTHSSPKISSSPLNLSLSPLSPPTMIT
jgi:hypothetical protein